MPFSDSPARTDGEPVLVFRVQLVLGGCGLVSMAAAVTAAAESVHRQTVGAHRLLVAGLRVTYPTLNVAAGALLALALLGAAVLATAVRETWRQLRASRRFVRGLRMVGPLRGHPGVTVIDTLGPAAFCAGFLRPRVYVSVRALELLDAEELRAVVEHEHHHRRVRDPLRMACARVLTRALFFLPALRPLHDRYADLAEQRADHAAVRAAAGRRAALASALLAFDASNPPGVSGISPHRVDSLLGAAPRWRPPALLVGLAVATLTGLAVLIWRASETASASATLNLPVLSSQPCVLALALMPLIACAAAVSGRNRPQPAERGRLP